MSLLRVVSPGAFGTVFGSALVLWFGIVLASAETSPRKVLLEEHLEKSEDAPIYIFQKGVSAAMISQQGPFTSYQVNVTSGGQNITGDAANEPSLTMDPTNRSKMSIGWRQFDSVGSNFRKAGYGYTTNGGLSWKFPGVLENNTFRSD